MDEKKYQLHTSPGLFLRTEDIERLLALRDGNCALLYLYLLGRGGALDENEAARTLGLTAAEVRAAAERLRRGGVLGEGGGKPLPPPEELPEYRSEDILLRSREDRSFRSLVNEAQAKLGHTLSGADLKTLFGIYDRLGLPCDVIMLLINRCAENARRRYGEGRLPTMHAIEKEAYIWCNREIVTLERAEEYLGELDRREDQSERLRQLLQIGAILTVSSQNDAAVLNGVAQELGVQAEVHVKIDTGMGRYGFLPDELDQLLPIFRYMPGLHVTGIYTHLHSAFCSQKATVAQAEAFQGVLDQLHAAGCETGMAHMLNSAGLLKYPQYAMDGVRVGSAILGRVSVRGNFGLTRIGECQATVEELRWLPKGHSCGYGAGWTAKKPTRVAVFSVGWYHGFGVEMGNDLFRFRDCLRGVLRNLRQMIFRRHITVTVNGKKCRVLGHIGMLHTCVDVTNVPCAVGDPAVFDLKPLLLKGIEVVYR